MHSKHVQHFGSDTNEDLNDTLKVQNVAPISLLARSANTLAAILPPRSGSWRSYA